MGPSRHKPVPGLWIGAAILVAALLLCAPLFSTGALHRGSDVYSTIHYLQGFMKAFGEGDLYPRWTDRTNKGLGAPAFVMFPPLAYYGAGFCAWLAGGIIPGVKLYFLLLAVATGVSFHALAREWVGPGWPAAIGAGIYLLLPYHVLDMYQRFALSETTGFVFYPLILLCARRSIERGGVWSFVGMSASYAGLIFTHLVSAFMFSIFLGLWLIVQLGRRRHAAPRIAAALACGLCLAAPALLPAALEKAHVNIAWQREAPNGDFRLNFIFKDDVIPGLGFKDPVKPPVLRSAHAQLGLALLSAGLALSWLSAAATKRRADVLALSAGCLLAYGLQLRVSTPIWLLVPELPTIQFPWRFQTIMVLVTALSAAHALAARREHMATVKRSQRRMVVAGPLLLGALLLVNLGLAWQNAHLKPFDFDESTAGSAGVVQWMEPAFTPVELTGYRRFRQTEIRIPRGEFLEGTGTVVVEEWLSSSRRLRIASDTGGTVVVGSFWFPGWSGSRNDEPLPLEATPGQGVISFRVPPGDHVVALEFEASPVRRSAAWIGFAALVAAPLAGRWTSPREDP